MVTHALFRAGIVLPLAACGILAAPSARSACSRPINAVYSTQPVADVYAAQPDRQLPSLQDAIAKASGCLITITIDPPARSWQDFKEGQIDLLLSTPPASNDHEHGQFLPMLKTPWVLITALPKSEAPQRLDDFVTNRHLLVSKIRGLPYPPDVDAVLRQLQQQQQIDEAVEIDMALDKLAAHRDAAMILTAGAYLLHVDRIHAAHLRPILQSQFAPALLGIYVSRKSLNDGDRHTLLAATRQVIKSGLPIGLLRTRLGEEDDADLLQAP